MAAEFAGLSISKDVLKPPPEVNAPEEFTFVQNQGAAKHMLCQLTLDAKTSRRRQHLHPSMKRYQPGVSANMHVNYLV